MLRKICVFLHRYGGLGMAGFLVVVGLTGSLLAFNIELERLFAPQLFANAPPVLAPLDLATLAERAQALVPQARLIYLAHTAPDQTKAYFEPLENPETQAPYDLDFTEFFVDPFTGAELGRRRNADLSQGAINLMPFIYDLHWRLVLGGFGQWTLGIIAFAWTIDCFVGFYLTLPHTTTAFWRRWKPAWLIKRGASFYRLNFDLHRAAGLWLWAMLFVFAWSSVMMDMRRPIYEWLMGSLFDFTSRIRRLSRIYRNTRRRNLNSIGAPPNPRDSAFSRSRGRNAASRRVSHSAFNICASITSIPTRRGAAST